MAEQKLRSVGRARVAIKRLGKYGDQLAGQQPRSSAWARVAISWQGRSCDQMGRANMATN